MLLATVFSGWKRNWADAATAYTQAYISTPYHHDLAPNANSTRVWGNVSYSWRTDHYSFRIGACAPGEVEKSWPAIFVIGDSFTEAMGSSYEKSFAGLMACDAAKQAKAVWNLGVVSYSPVIYHRKDPRRRSGQAGRRSPRGGGVAKWRLWGPTVTLRENLHQRRDTLNEIAARHGTSNLHVFDLAEDRGLGDNLDLVPERERILQRPVDLVLARSLSLHFRPYVEADAVPL